MTWIAKRFRIADFGLRIEDIAVQFAQDVDAQFFPLGARDDGWQNIAIRAIRFSSIRNPQFEVRNHP